MKSLHPIKQLVVAFALVGLFSSFTAFGQTCPVGMNCKMMAPAPSATQTESQEMKRMTDIPETLSE